ncbi:unnamed protein product, partial [Mesorhabditis belari]|uniref:Transthyretin-like family protein n=1 Tax=Mesorhabditis belari TaxID=2138241 RepID=A0AAF3FQP0_9BILA
MIYSILIVSMAFVQLIAGNLESVAVQGRLVCNGQPVSGVRVKLYDDNTLSPDTKLGEVTTNQNGNFQLTGTSDNWVSDQDPKFNIYHRCGMTVPVCYYKSSYDIPYQYVTVGTQPQQVYNAQTIELSMLPKDRDCLNRRK